MLDNQYP